MDGLWGLSMSIGWFSLWRKRVLAGITSILFFVIIITTDFGGALMGLQIMAFVCMADGEHC